MAVRPNLNNLPVDRELVADIDSSDSEDESDLFDKINKVAKPVIKNAVTGAARSGIRAALDVASPGEGLKGVAKDLAADTSAKAVGGCAEPAIDSCVDAATDGSREAVNFVSALFSKND